jgi:murein DD-endopeptidase MepM/ murein hydrolase activator NlpD
MEDTMDDLIRLALNPPRATKRGIHIRARVEPTKPFQWPLRRFGGRDPGIVAEYVDNNRRGVELRYAPAHYDAQLFVPVHAANDGEVALALETPSGFAITLDHGGTWSTHYTRLSKIFVTPCMPRLRRRQRVNAGDVISYTAKSPLAIGFEVWQWTDERGFAAIDPIPLMNNWLDAPVVEPASEAA